MLYQYKMLCIIHVIIIHYTLYGIYHISLTILAYMFICTYTYQSCWGPENNPMRWWNSLRDIFPKIVPLLFFATLTMQLILHYWTINSFHPFLINLKNVLKWTLYRVRLKFKCSASMMSASKWDYNLLTTPDSVETAHHIYTVISTTKFIYFVK